ncbi:MAG: hypothetical protein R3B82_01905 [Sandaracinaceae bacterium]
MRAQLLGSTVKVGPTQFLSIYVIAKHRVTSSRSRSRTSTSRTDPHPNAFTYGTDANEESSSS